jgi:glycosyltransferase involved in cell wall biosynthesis
MPTTRFSGKQKRRASSPGVMRVDHAATRVHSRTSAKRHPWSVVHACELAREVLPLVEGQLAAGMRPSLLTPGGFGLASSFVDNSKRTEATQISLLRMWNHVRDWRKLLNNSAAETSSEIIHAHSFAAGMAAVRASSGVVYQFKQPIEKLATPPSGNQDENSWLVRSFRVAEQFILTRAAAVVVHNHRQRVACLERGVAAGSVFLIPEPIDSHLLELQCDRHWLEGVTEASPDTIFFLIPGLPKIASWDERDALLRWMRVLSVIRHEHPNVKFVFLVDLAIAGHVRDVASTCNLSCYVSILGDEFRDRAMASADVVICDREHAARQSALEAMARGRALLAADIEEHREFTSDGRGCLWYRPGDVGDVAQRAGFLAGNVQFRRALGVAAREHCLATRGVEVVGAQYDAVYRVAFSKRKGRDNSTPKTQLIPLQVGS